MILIGPIVIRLLFELLMMGLLLVKNVIAINAKLKNQNDGTGNGTDVFAAPNFDEIRDTLRRKSEPADQAQPAQHAYFCGSCGAKLDADGKCPNCGQN